MFLRRPFPGGAVSHLIDNWTLDFSLLTSHYYIMSVVILVRLVECAPINSYVCVFSTVRQPSFTTSFWLNECKYSSLLLGSSDVLHDSHYITMSNPLTIHGGSCGITLFISLRDPYKPPMFSILNQHWTPKYDNCLEIRKVFCIWTENRFS